MIYGLIFQGDSNITPQEQRDAIVAYADKHSLKIDQFILYNERPDITLFKSGDSVIFFAWHCICTKRAFLTTLIQYFLKHKIRLYSATSTYCVNDTADFKQFESAFNLYEDIRFNFLSNKNLNGVKLRVANGYSLGRPFGSKNKRHVLDGKGNAILEMYSNGVSMYAIARKMKVSAPTIKRFLASHN